MNVRHLYRILITLLLCAFVLAAGCSGARQSELSGVDNTVKGKRTAKVLDQDQLITHASGDPAASLAGDQATPSVAFYDVVGTMGVYLSVYTSSNGNTTEIHGVVCQGAGSASTSSLSCGDDKIISTSSLQPRQSQPKVAFDLNSKKFMVVWVHSSGSPTGAYSQIYGSAVTINPTTKTFTSTPATSVTPDPDGFYYTYQSDPEIVYNPALDKFVISWLDTSAADGNREINRATVTRPWKSGDVTSVNYTGTGTIASVDSIISASTGTVLAPASYLITGLNSQAVSITIQPGSPIIGQQGSLTINYTDSNGVKDKKTNSSTWVAGDSITYSSLGIAKENASNITKMFREGATDQFGNSTSGVPVTSFTETFNDFPFNLSSVLTINSGSNAIGTSNPITVYTFANNLVVDTVKGSRCDNSIGPVISVPQSMVGGSLIRSTEIGINFIKPVVAKSNFQEPSAITSSGSSDSGSSFMQNFTLQLNESNPKIIVNPSTGQYDVGWSGSASAFSLVVSYAPVGTSTYCTYGSASYTTTDNDAGKTKIKVRRNSGFGSAVTYSYGTGNASGLTSAVDSNTNRVLLAWEDDQQIVGSLFDISSFTQYGSLIPISTIAAGVLNSPRTSPKAAFDNVNQRFLTVWEDARNQSANLSNIDIYGQFIDPQGNLSGGNTIVTVARGNQLAPAIIFGNAQFRKFLVVFKDGRDPSNSDIYGQMLEYSTAPQLALYTKDSAGIVTPLLNGALDFGTISVGSVLDKTVIIRNDGNTNLTILTNGINDPATPYSFLTPKPVTINPGTQYEMIIRFAPFASGSYADPDPAKNFFMSINSDGGKAIVYFSGSGSGSNPLSINTSTFPDASPTTPATTYTAQLSGSGGVYPYTWDITGGELPASLSAMVTVVNGKKVLPANIFNAQTGTITWQPLAADVKTTAYNILVTLTDNNSPNSSTSRIIPLKVGSISIKEPTNTQLASWGIGTETTPGVFTGADYSLAGMQFKASTNNVVSSNYNWTVSKGALPKGIVFDPVTKGLLTGIPEVSGTFTFTVRATDPTDATLFADLQYSLTINPQPVILTTSLPPGTLGGAYNFAITMTGGTAPFSWSISPGYSMPPGLVFSNGVISGTPTAAATYKISVSLTDATGTVAKFPVDISTGKNELSLQINAGLDITTPTSGTNSPKMATASSYYSFAFAATGGTEPYTWDVVAGTLPPGLTLQPGSGGLSGIPDANAPGNYSFNLRVRDNSGTSITKTYKIVVAPPLNIGTSTLAAWTLNTGGYSQQLAAVGGATPYSWSWQGALVQVVSGTTTIQQRSQLPAGLILNPTTGLISGTPTTVGAFEIDVTLTDVNSATITKKLTLQVNDQLKITTSSLAAGIEGVLYVPQQITFTGGTSAYTWTYTGVLPAGLTFNSGVISGIPNAGTAGTYPISVTVKDAANASFTQSLSITVAPPQSSTLSITTASVGDMKTNIPVSFTLLASGGTVPYSWKVIGGAFPAGIALNSAGGTIAGTPGQAGNYSVDIMVTDINNNSAVKNYSFVVRDPFLITSSALKSWDKDLVGYVDTLTATGGRIPYLWDIIDGTGAAIAPVALLGVPVPGVTGLYLNQTTGVISGTPTVATGTYSFTVRVSDAATPKEAVLKQLSITITSSMTISTTIPSMVKSAATSFTLTAIGGTAPRIWSSTVLPDGLSLAPNTGIVSGTPSAAGTYDVVFTVTDQTGRTATLPRSITVDIPGTTTPTNNNTLAFIDQQRVPLANSTLIFGSALPDSTNTKQFSLYNSGSAPITITKVTVSDSSFATNLLVGTIIQPGITNAPVITVTFIPQIVKNYSATVTIEDSSGATSILKLSGSGSLNTGGTGGTVTTGTNVAPSASSTGGKSGCFIATAAYGSYLDPHVMVLRHFRDDVLLQSKAGTAFVKFYYHYSPPIADYIAQHDVLRMLLRFALTPLIFMVKLGWFNLLFAFLAGFAAIRIMNRKVSVMKVAMIKSQGDL